MGKITYVQLEGTPGILFRDDSGIYVYEYVDGKWREPPDNGADMGTKSSVLSQEQFERMFPDVGMPDQIKEHSA